MARELDVIVWGSTGFTGSLVAEYLAKNYSGRISWGLGGRNQAKLEEVRQRLVEINPTAKDIPILTANISDPRSMEALVSKASVIISTAGPFLQLGTPVVEACVKVGTDYVDITGETNWVRSLVDKYHKQAEESGAFIVPCCGFDSIPSDLGTYMMVEAARSQGKKCTGVTALATAIKGTASGGTLHSGLGIIEAVPLRELIQMNNGYYLIPEEPQDDSRRRRKAQRTFEERDRNGLAYNSELKKWMSPFVMQSINSKVVRRSLYLLPEVYGDYLDFHYTEAVATSSFFIALISTILYNLVVVLLLFSFVRTLVKKVIPKPGEGPTRKQIDEGFFHFKYVADIEGGKKLIGISKGLKDPGYGETAKMVSESALCLVLDRQKVKQRRAGKGGILTPASAFGSTLLDRLREAGMTWTVLE
eukprot:TRINITY_DN3162_c0_g1_i2.p1 TRINITY_DN3162_c0_g1~~TRINITY_DN3162_c0_g1_i2.p1  ORF type:complete len:433 (-),score=128.00 TRINITY_DN3162_c0_g1_i2:118-1371(-)